MPFRDPVTGDELTRLEYYTRQVQTWVRTPWFILAFNLITILAFAFGHPLEWNDFASWLAVIIEWLVGTYMFGQTGRDATYIRKIAKLVILVLRLGKQNKDLLRRVEKLEEVNQRQLTHLETLVAQISRPDAPGDGQAGLHREAAEATERRPSPTPSDPDSSSPAYRPDDDSSRGPAMGQIDRSGVGWNLVWCDPRQ